MKKIISLFLTLVLTLIISFSFSNTSFASDIKYIPQSQAESMAETHINNRILQDKECPWKSQTKIGQVISLYDPEDKVNSYVFNLTTDGKETGFIFVEANKIEPVVQQFCYDGHFMNDKLLKSNESKLKTIDKYKFDKTKIYYLGGYKFLIKGTKNQSHKAYLNKSYSDENTEEVFYDLTNSEILNYEKSEINKDYKKSIAAVQKLEDTKLSRSPRVNSKRDVDSLNSANFFVTSDFSKDGFSGNCGPTSGTTLISYWAKQRGKSGLFHESWQWVHNGLYKHMNCRATGCTNKEYYDGILKYASYVRGVPATGSDLLSYDKATFTKAKNCIDYNQPFAVGLVRDPKYHNHFVTCFGYEDNSDGKYLRIADGWEHTHNMWYRYNLNYIDGFIYARWN